MASHRVFGADVLRKQGWVLRSCCMALGKLDKIERGGCSNPWWFGSINTALPVVELECPDTIGPAGGPWERGTKGS